jgi:IclR family transcriptional regulator, pca regulon regulatory protein
VTENANKPSNVYAQSFARGLEVIRAFGDDRPVVTLSDIAKRANMTRATARRLLHTLVAEGYAKTDGKYFSLTPRVLDLGYSYLSSMSIWGAAQNYVEQLVEQVHESASISVLDGDDIVYVLRVPTKRILKSSLSIGSRIPAHVISMGRIQLAALTDEELDAYIDRVQLRAFTARTLTDKTLLKARILEDRKQGWSVVSGELEEVIAGIAVPILSKTGRTVAALNVSLYPERLAEPGKHEFLLRHLQSAARNIGAMSVRTLLGD